MLPNDNEEVQDYYYPTRRLHDVRNWKTGFCCCRTFDFKYVIVKPLPFMQHKGRYGLVSLSVCLPEHGVVPNGHIAGWLVSYKS